MTLRRREQPRDVVPAAKLHFLLTGCWRVDADLDVYIASAAALRGRRVHLREMWATHGAAVKRSHSVETWAELVLALPDGRNPGDVMAGIPPVRCATHGLNGDTDADTKGRGGSAHGDDREEDDDAQADDHE